MMNVAYVSNVGHDAVEERTLFMSTKLQLRIMLTYCTAPFRHVLCDALEYVCMSVNYSSITLSVPIRVWATPGYEAARTSPRVASFNPALRSPDVIACILSHRRRDAACSIDSRLPPPVTMMMLSSMLALLSVNREGDNRKEIKLRPFSAPPLESAHRIIGHG